MSRLRLSALIGASAFLASATAMAAPVIDDITLGDNVASGGVQKCSGSAACSGGFGPSNWTGPAFVGYQDQVTQPGAPAWAAGKTFRWGDVIGDPNVFNIESLRIEKTADSISFTQKTKFNGYSIGAYTSHMFIDTLTPLIADTFNYAIVLGPDQDAVDSDGAGPDVAKTGLNLRPGYSVSSGLYSVTAANIKTPADIWTSGTWGGLIQFCQDTNGAAAGTCQANDPDAYDNGTNTDGIGLAPAVLATGLTSAQKVGDVTWSRVNGGDGWYYLKAVITNVDMSLFEQFDILATAADCANDALWGPVQTTVNEVPVPGAVFLLGFGLLGLAGVRRRKTA